MKLVALTILVVILGVVGFALRSMVFEAEAARKPIASPFQGIWEGTNRIGGQDWLEIDHETGGVFSTRYYAPDLAGCGGTPGAGLGGAHFSEELGGLHWFSWFWCLEDPPLRNAVSLCTAIVYDEASDTLTCDDWATWHRTNARWHNIVP